MTNFIPNSKITTRLPSSLKLEAFTFNLNASLNSKPFKSDGEWVTTKEKILHSLSKTMAIVASHFAFNFEIQDVFLMERWKSTNEKEEGQNQQIEMTKDLGVI